MKKTILLTLAFVLIAFLSYAAEQYEYGELKLIYHVDYSGNGMFVYIFKGGKNSQHGIGSGGVTEDKIGEIDLEALATTDFCKRMGWKNRGHYHLTVLNNLSKEGWEIIGLTKNSISNRVNRVWEETTYLMKRKVNN